MPRPPRHFVPGLPAHLVHRGNNRQDIFACDGDFLFFRGCLERAMARHAVALHGYVLMSNHVHLLMTPATPVAIPQMMQSAIRRYAGYFNSRYSRTGTLWEGRFHATVIESDRYLLACHRYIDMNPVRAAIVDRPERYPWSSHRHFALGESDTLLGPHPLVLALADSHSARQAAYRALFHIPMDPADLARIRKASQSGRPLNGFAHRWRAPGRPKRKLVPDTIIRSAGIGGAGDGTQLGVGVVALQEG